MQALLQSPDPSNRPAKSLLRTRVFSANRKPGQASACCSRRAHVKSHAMAPYLQKRPEGVCISLKVQPRASRNEIAGPIGNELKIKVTAPPVDSAANEAVLELLAETLGCARNQFELIRGATSRHKQILVRGLTTAQIEEKLR